MNRIKVDKFRRFGFANTTYITGGFKVLDIDDKLLIKDSNFRFESDKFKISSLSGMFSGCENAVFSHTLNITSNLHTDASEMFKGCKFASLPKVNIGNSWLQDCESMFEGCFNATLDGVTLPPRITNVKRMFKGCKTASFDTIGQLTYYVDDYTEMFYGCKNATLSKLRMPSPRSSAEFNFSYMFYGCENMNADGLYFEDSSDYAVHTDYMFYGAGRNGSEALDSCVINFGKLKSCTSMFDSSKFSFSSTFLQFYSNGSIHNGYRTSIDVDSISRLFYNTNGIVDKAPTIVLADMDIRDPQTMDMSLGGDINGHYTVRSGRLIYGITDFTETYAYSNMKTLDIRGISNNTDLDSMIEANGEGVADFSSMAEGCSNLRTLIGKIPHIGYSYDSMFYGCENLELDLSKSFMVGTYNVSVDGQNGNSFSSYYMTSVAKMFGKCAKIYSSSDSFDAVSIPKTIRRNLDIPEDDEIHDIERNSLRGLFPSITIATKNPFKGLELVDYDISEISSEHHIIRYNSFEDDEYDVNGGVRSTFGIHSEFPRIMFADGFYRFGGFFKNDPTKYFCIIEHPLKDDTDGNVNSFYVQNVEYSPSLIPHEFSSTYKFDSDSGSWNEFKFDKLYAAKVFNKDDDTFVGNYFVGPYTRKYSERRIVDGELKILEKNVDMPVTYFDSYSNDITVLEL